MIRALLVDDSPGSLRTLRNLLGRYCPQIEIVGEALSAHEGYEQMLIHDPNLLFLDIEMPGGSGFDLLEMAVGRSFEVIFITAFDHYALEAIRHCALDYVLKPVGHLRLVEAVDRAEDRLNEQGINNRFVHLLEKIPRSDSSIERLSLPQINGFLFIPVNDVLYCLADGIYSKVLLKDKRELLTTRRLKELEDTLEVRGFFRIHRSILVNLHCVEEYIRGEGGFVVMTDGKSLNVSRNKREELLKRLQVL